MEAEEGPSGSARAGVPKAWVGAQEESEGALRRGRHQGHVALGSPDPELGGVSRAAPGCLRGRGAQRPCCQKTRQQASTHPGIKRPVSHARSVTRRSSRWPCSLAALQGVGRKAPESGSPSRAGTGGCPGCCGCLLLSGAKPRGLGHP